MPTTEKGTNRPRSTPYASRRSREYLTPREIDALMKTARQSNRYGHRDATMILIGYRHGLRPSEACALCWDQINFEHGHLYVRRAKNGTPSVHPLRGVELRALRKLKREQKSASPYAFTSHHATPMTVPGRTTVNDLQHQRRGVA